MMTKREYLESLYYAHNDGKISDEAYDAALMNADNFTYDEEEEDENL